MIRKTISRALLLVALFMISIAVKAASDSYVPKKREFRGAWIQCVNGQFIGMSTQKMLQTLTYQLDELQKDGVNAIFFRSGQSVMRCIKATSNRGAASLQDSKERLRRLTGIRCNG